MAKQERSAGAGEQSVQVGQSLGPDNPISHLVSCPRNTRYFAGGQLAVFQGAVRAGLAVEAPISE
jgi:hypothetical protein